MKTDMNMNVENYLQNIGLDYSFTYFVYRVFKNLFFDAKIKR